MWGRLFFVLVSSLFIFAYKFCSCHEKLSILLCTTRYWEELFTCFQFNGWHSNILKSGRKRIESHTNSMLIPCMTEIPPQSDKQLTIELSVGFFFLFSVGGRKANWIAKNSRVGLLVGIEMGRMSKGQLTNSTVFKSFYPSNAMTCGQIQISTRLPLKVQLWILRMTAASSSIHTQIHNWTFTKATKMIQVGVKEIFSFLQRLGSVRDDVNLTRDALIISTSFHISVSPVFIHFRWPTSTHTRQTTFKHSEFLSKGPSEYF